MAEWYLATYQNGVFSNDLGAIQPSGDYVYKLKNGIQSGESPVKSDWLRITITNTDNKVEEWDNSSWTEDTSLTGLVNESTYWVYGKPYSYSIVTNDQTYYLKSFSNGTGKDINDSDVTINATAITAVTIGPSVTSIGESAFSSCSSLASVTIPDSVTEIGNNAFSQCSSLAFVTIGDSVTSIGTGAFYQCSSLASVTIPDSVTSIGDYAFYYCTKLMSVTIGRSINEIGESAFLGCESLYVITVPQSFILANFNNGYWNDGENFYGSNINRYWSVNNTGGMLGVHVNII